MRILAVDFGERRIGIALSDEGGAIAYPYQVIERISDRKAIAEIERICREKGVGKIILGCPYSLKGKETAITRRVLSFLRKLRKIGIDVLLYDERWTTKIASRISDRMVDARAAAIMLGDYLEQMRCSK